MSLRALRSELIALLRARNREDLVQGALEDVVYTDDGSTLYIHILPKATWPRRRPGQAYVLAFADHPQVRSLSQHRALLEDAWFLLHDEIAGIVRWFDGP